MKLIVFMVLTLFVFPIIASGQVKVSIVNPQSSQKVLNENESERYKSFLNEMRRSDRKREYAEYRDDRDTRLRKLRESIIHEAIEANIASQRAWDARYRDAYDTRMSYINKGYSAPTDRESYKAFRAADQLRPPSKSSVDIYSR